MHVLKIIDAMPLCGFLIIGNQCGKMYVYHIMLVAYGKSVKLWISIENHDYGWDILTYTCGENYDWAFL